MESKKNKFKEGVMGRYRWIFLSIALFALLVEIMLFKTTIIEKAEWDKKAAETLLGDTVIAPERGSILADDGSQLAVSASYYEVALDFRAPGFKEKLFRKHIKSTVKGLVAVGRFKTEEECREALNVELAKPANKRKRAFMVSKKMTKDELMEFLSLPYFSERGCSGMVSQNMYDCREKPYGKMARRSIGNIDSTGMHGSSGLERALDSLLYGKPGRGMKVQLTNKIQDWAEVEPVRGYDIQTTINVEIQDIVESVLYKQCLEQRPEWATCVVMEVATGEIKAISNLSYNKTFQDYVETVNNAFLAWELGSVMKPISIMIALEDGLTTPDEHFDISGNFAYAQARPITDSHFIGNYPSVSDILAGSSNKGTAKIITRSFGEHPWDFHRRLEEIGMFDHINAGIAGEGDVEMLPLGSKDKKFLNEWRVNLSRACYGYAVQIPPIKNLTFMNAIANGGKMVRPRLMKALWLGDSLVKEFKVDYIRQQICSETVARQMREMLHEVVWCEKERVATGTSLRNNFVDIAGKTGTSNIFVPHVGYMKSRNRLTFCGFFPYDKPKYSCIVVFNDPVGVFYRSAAKCSGFVFRDIALKLYARGLLGNFSDFRSESDNSGAPALTLAMDKDKSQRVAASCNINKRKQYPYAPGSKKGTVPNVIGMGLRDAVAILESNGVLTGSITGSGCVVKQSPEAGTPIRKGVKVNLELNN